MANESEPEETKVTEPSYRLSRREFMVFAGVSIVGEFLAACSSIKLEPTPTPTKVPTAVPRSTPTKVPTATSIPTPTAIPSIERGSDLLGKIAYLTEIQKPPAFRRDLDDSVARLYICNPDGTETKLISENASLIFPPLWSPSGDKFVALLYDGKNSSNNSMFNYSIYDRTGVNLVAFRGPTPWHLDWASDDSSVIFTDGYYRGGYRFQEYNITTHQIRDLFHGVPGDPAKTDLYPTVSPDGQKLVFSHQELWGDYYIAMFKFDPTKFPYRGDWGKNPYGAGLSSDFKSLLLGNNEEAYDREIPYKFLWTSDSKKIVFLAPNGINILDADSFSAFNMPVHQFCYLPDKDEFFVDYKQNKLYLQRCPFTYKDIDLSSDGKQIVLGIRDSLLITGIEGGNQRKISLPTSKNIPRWIPKRSHWLSADRKISFINANRIYVINSDGTSLREVPTSFGVSYYSYGWSRK